MTSVLGDWLKKDQLTHDERLRLEALAQAVHVAGTLNLSGGRTLVEMAKKFEDFIRNGNT